MKKIMLILMVSLFSIHCIAQKELIVSGIDVNQTSAHYIEVTLLTPKLMKPTQLECYVDWGEIEEKGKTYRIQEGEKEKVFKSRVELYNYLYVRGWKFVYQYEDIIPRVGTYTRHVFERKK